VWSSLLLSEFVNGWQVVGIAMVVIGLVAFVIAHQRGKPGAARAAV
jgi:drug/metabolite transporter (DMT)-like permease